MAMYIDYPLRLTETDSQAEADVGL
jgi:hypothetical protein